MKVGECDLISFLCHYHGDHFVDSSLLRQGTEAEKLNCNQLKGSPLNWGSKVTSG